MVLWDLHIGDLSLQRSFCTGPQLPDLNTATSRPAQGQVLSALSWGPLNTLVMNTIPRLYTPSMVPLKAAQGGHPGSQHVSPAPQDEKACGLPGGPCPGCPAKGTDQLWAPWLRELA